MPLEDIAHMLFLGLVTIMIAGIVIIPPLWALLTIFAPKKLLDRFFKEPHFTSTEIIVMAHFPASLMRTSMFSWVLLLQPYGFKTKRKISNLDDYMPKWYAFALRFLAIYVAFTIISIIILFIVLYGMLYHLDRLPDIDWW